MMCERICYECIKLKKKVLSQRTFSVSAQDNSGPRSEVKVYRFHRPIQETEEYESKGFLKRSKRRWSPPPFNILENDAGPFPKEIEKIVSDSSAKYDVYYTISGPGVDQYPVGVFSLNQNTGMLSVHKPVDREEFPNFTVTTRVFNRVTNVETDLALPITVIIDDVNDNAPTFSSPLQFTVPEKCAAGTMVGKVNATDRDQEGSDHVKIRYSLLSGSDLFTVNPLTGVITTLTNTLDREVNEKQLVVVQIKDMNGAANGLFNTGTATITLSDINDNPPTFIKSSYKVDVKENESDRLILRIPVEDKDLINTPNWISKFVISKGNEQGNFRIDNDPKTNEGLLFVSKALDYEQTNNIKLEIMARNEADLKGTTAQWQSIPVNVTVINVDEGPQFSAPTVTFTVKENSPNGTVIGSYTATDPETKSSNGIMYYKVKDPASWISVDRTTGELKVANTIDRESHFVQDGVYNVTMKAVDATSKTGTGTVIILVEDVNDNMPLVPSGELVLCEKEGELGSVMVVAEDKDQNPFSSPFSFSLGPGQEGTWSLERQNSTAAKLQQKKQLNTGIHEVPVKVMDLQGYGDEQKVKVRICQCKNGVCLAKPRSVSFGPFGILALLLPLALLLLLGILLAFFCMMGREKIPLPDGTDSGGILLKSNTEAPGEEVDSSNFFPFPTNGFEQNGVKGSVMNADWGKTKNSSTMGAIGMQDSAVYKSGFNTNEFVTQYDNRYCGFGGGQLLGSGFDNRYLTQDSTFHHTWQTNGRCLHQKVGYLGNEDDGRYADDIVHSYRFEGVGSAAGSVGCCSDYSDNDNLEFLNTLGPKFKTLAETCTMKT
ncbi:hypothetical protein L3Q82_006166 [Scortum barcoo]|uniref:Uncharacterized protein n=1 Tax=Scortum barcoo TaxID=214431 RepID=A0ACB8X2X7_9TELE|nr:hypothetical protein L3Q82_006166 [Scortum barcoo]